jgi:hypothetical protein
MRYVLNSHLGAVLIDRHRLGPTPGRRAKCQNSRKSLRNPGQPGRWRNSSARTLKEALQQAIQNGGPANGISVCHDKAGTRSPPIFSQKLDLNRPDQPQNPQSR